MHAAIRSTQAEQLATLQGSAGMHVHEVLAFTLGHEEYGVSILKVQEIRGYDAVTQIANAPDFVKGVINLRGIIVPIIDMRIKFNLGTPSYDQLPAHGRHHSQHRRPRGRYDGR
jgi:chemotaxis signal transduction protein